MNFPENLKNVRLLFSQISVTHHFSEFITTESTPWKYSGTGLESRDYLWIQKMIIHFYLLLHDRVIMAVR